MYVVISSGHGKYIRGASSSPIPPYLDEVDEARKVVDRVAEYLKSAGVKVDTFHDNTSHDQDTNLKTIVNYHNSRPAHDLDVSCHFNANVKTSNPMGAETWHHSSNSDMKALAKKVTTAWASVAGFKDRGPKPTTGLYFINKTKADSILLEICFVDSSADGTLYRESFEAICEAIAGALSGKEIPIPPPKPEPDPDDDPRDIPLEDRPVLGKGDKGFDVVDLQELLNDENDAGLFTDGDFGSLTDQAVTDYQWSRGLAADGICGPVTWEALYESKQPLPPPPHALTAEEQMAICDIANNSSIAGYSWKNQGKAPKGYTQGMALAFAQTYRKLLQGHPAAEEMAQPRKDSDKDALNIYKKEFASCGMDNEKAGPDVLRHLYALMLGHGMRESNGKHCCGRDTSAGSSSQSSDTCEAGLFQTSYNAHAASDPEFDALMAEYSNVANRATCYLEAFDDGVSCSESDWECVGSGDGFRFQQLCKNCPAFSVETAALTLRNLCNHYGPIIRHEAELKTSANEMFKAVQDYIDSTGAIA